MIGVLFAAAVLGCALGLSAGQVEPMAGHPFALPSAVAGTLLAVQGRQVGWAALVGALSTFACSFGPLWLRITVAVVGGVATLVLLGISLSAQEKLRAGSIP